MDGVQSDGCASSSFLKSSPCSAQTQWHFQTVLPFQMLLHDFSLLLFHAFLNGLFEVSSSTPNNPSLQCSNVMLTEVTSVKQKWACWHFTKPCPRPSVCFKLGVGLAQIVELASSLVHVWLMGLDTNGLFLGFISGLSHVRHLEKRTFNHNRPSNFSSCCSLLSLVGSFVLLVSVGSS